jgi:hypothetical protein
MSIQRPDKVPAGPTVGRTYFNTSIGECSIQLYPNFKHFAIRAVLIRANRWYGSLFEMHIGSRGNGFEFDYFDFMFLRYFIKQLNPSVFKKLLTPLAMPWNLLDKGIKNLVQLDMWKEINKAVPTAQSIKNNLKLQQRDDLRTRSN